MRACSVHCAEASVWHYSARNSSHWREMTQRPSEISPPSLENVAQPIENVAQQDRSGEHLPASLGADTPDNVLSSGLDSAENSHANTTDSQPGASHAQGTSSSTPWKRSGQPGNRATGQLGNWATGQPGNRATAAAESAASSVAKQRATDAATNEPTKTPWSTMSEPTPVTDPKVFPPDTAGPAPVLPADSLASAAERPNKAAVRVAEPPV